MYLDDEDSLASVTEPPPLFKTVDFYKLIPEDAVAIRDCNYGSQGDFKSEREERLSLNGAFNKLYGEYVSVCEKYLENENMRQINYGDDQISEIDTENKVTKSAESPPRRAESPHGLKKSINSSAFKTFKSFFIPSINFSLCMKKSGAKELKKSRNFKIIDRLIEENVKVFEVIEKRHKFKVCHQILKKSNNKMINIPIVMELLLKKMQQKIDYILSECSFLCDPLEVMSELRSHDYDEVKCIKYFQETKYLRYLYHSQETVLALPAEEESEEKEEKKRRENGKMREKREERKNGEEIEENIRKKKIEEVKNKGKIEEEDKEYEREDREEIRKRREKEEIIKGKTVIMDCIQQKCNNVKYKNISFSSINNYVEFESNYSVNENSKILKRFSNISTQTEETSNHSNNLSINFHKLKQSHIDINVDIKYLAFQLNKVFHSLRSHMITVINQCSERLINNEQKSRLLTFSRQVDELKLKLKEEEENRRQVYNRMQEQMGNVRVYCRCRNLSDDENVLEYLGEDSLILTTVSNETFEFDKVFPPGITQSELYEEFRPLVMSFIDGYNVCFITYGGEASGKTYTLIGDNIDQSHQGIMQRSLLTILIEEKSRQRDWNYKISACVVEIYNDNCTDIFSGESGIQIYVDNGMETAYQKLKSVPITNEADVDVLIKVCTVKRKVARTALNPASSRSHLITIIRLEGCSKIHGENICSFLCLSDLAGFEDIIKAETHTNKILSKEAGYINKSLTAFSRVFVSLKKQDPSTVSFRDTKLTHLLKPFLTNSGKCALIVTVRNDKRSVGSTHNTLRFGKETRGVSLGRARRQVNLNNHT